MIKNNEMPDILPIFSFSGALLLPEGCLPLKICEPHYISMIEDILATKHRLIGIIQPCPLKGDNGKALYKVGCAGRIVGFKEKSNGHMEVTLLGIQRFTVKNRLEDKADNQYIIPDWSDYEHDQDCKKTSEEISLCRNKLKNCLEPYFCGCGIDVDWNSLTTAPLPRLIDILSMVCPFGADEKQALLEAENGESRAQLLQKLIKASSFCK